MPHRAHTAPAVKAASQPRTVPTSSHAAAAIAATPRRAARAARAGHGPSDLAYARASIQGSDRPRSARPESSAAQMRLEEAQDAAPGVLRRGSVVADAGHPQQRPARPEVVPVEEGMAGVRVLAHVVLDPRA